MFLTQSETSTGVVADVRALAAAAREAGALSVVDAISSLGAVPLETDEWGIDVVVAGSQKALMTPPGLAFASVSQRQPRAASGARLLLRLGAQPQGAGRSSTRPSRRRSRSWSRSTSRSGCCSENGLEAAFERHVRLGRACREGAKAMGLELFSPDDDSSAVVTAVKMPDGVDGRRGRAQTLRDRLGITLAGGQGPIKGKVVRIGHIGWFDVFDIATALAGLELVLGEAGADIERGVAVSGRSRRTNARRCETSLAMSLQLK